jgi:hypothetical protein
VRLWNLRIDAASTGSENLIVPGGYAARQGMTHGDDDEGGSCT